MRRESPSNWLRCALPAVALCLVWMMSGIGSQACAMSRAEIYQSTAPLADRSESSQAAAFQTALRNVMVKVTGRRTADEDAAFAPLYSSARRYVQQYRSTTDGQLWVAFDGAAIERWLTQNGQPLWGRERPTTWVALAVQTGPQGGSMVTAESSSELKSAIDAAAAARGISLIWPSAADLQRNRLDYAAVSSGPIGAVAEVGRRLGADAVLVGKAANDSAGAVVRWTHQFQDRSSEFLGSVEGVNRAADLYAGLFATNGALAPVDIEVSGIADLKAYAGVQSYLESLTAISHVSLLAMSGDNADFRLNMRGGADALQRALAAGGRLQPQPSNENGMQRFQFRR